MTNAKTVATAHVQFNLKDRGPLEYYIPKGLFFRAKLAIIYKRSNKEPRMSKLKTVKIIDTIYPNLGIGYYGDDKDRQIRVKNALLGQKVEAIGGRRRKNYIQGQVYQVLEKSDLETIDGCIHKDKCGGCSYQSLSYEDELSYKNLQVQNLFKEYNIRKIIPSPSHKYYRNKMEYTFGDEYKGSDLALGMHKKNRFYEIVNTFKCQIVHPDFNIIQENIRNYLKDLGYTHYHKKLHTGNLRHLVIRRTSLGQILINLVITHDTSIDKEALIDYLKSLDLEGKIRSIYITCNDSMSDAIVPEKVELIYGDDHVEEEILGFRFKIGPFSFFQTNTESAEVLYTTGIEMLDDIDNKVIYDLYSGTGTISQILAQRAEKVYGIEIVEEAVEGARESARINNIENVEFIQGDVLDKLGQIQEDPHTIVIDPPREGIVPKSLDKILSYNVGEILYISCNPITMYQNIKAMEEKGYKAGQIVLVDQFPRTNHTEALTLLKRN